MSSEVLESGQIMLVLLEEFFQSCQKSAEARIYGRRGTPHSHVRMLQVFVLKGEALEGALLFFSRVRSFVSRVRSKYLERARVWKRPPQPRPPALRRAPPRPAAPPKTPKP